MQEYMYLCTYVEVRGQSEVQLFSGTPSTTTTMPTILHYLYSPSFILRISPPTVTFFSVSITYAGNKRQDLVGVYLTSWARVIGWPSEGFSHLYSPRAWVSSVCHHSRHLYMGSKGCIQVFQLARQALHWAPVSRLLLSTMFFAVAYLTFYFGSTEEWTSLMLSSFFAFVIFYDSRFWPLDTPSIGIYPPCSITGSISQTLRN